MYVNYGYKENRGKQKYTCYELIDLQIKNGRTYISEILK